jgi:hypothetical protein
MRLLFVQAPEKCQQFIIVTRDDANFELLPRPLLPRLNAAGLTGPLRVPNHSLSCSRRRQGGIDGIGTNGSCNSTRLADPYDLLSEVSAMQ